MTDCLLPKPGQGTNDNNTNEYKETTIGKARITQETNKIDKPIIIIGFRPNLSEREPLIGEKMV